MKIVVATVIFNEAVEYLPDFLESLYEQTDSQFDIILVNDNISDEKLNEIKQCVLKQFYNRFTIVDKSDFALTPAQLRVEMIKSAFELKYDLLIMQDCDDMAEKNRVKHIRDQFESEYGFFYNELRDFSGKVVMPTLTRQTLDYRDIVEYNYLGMSNGAINLRRLTKDFIDSLKNGETAIFDWYMYSRMLLKGEKGKKIEDTYTFYRIYESNIAGRCNHSQEAINKEVDVKKKHYRLLEGYEERYKKLATLYENNQYFEINENENGYWWSLTKGYVD